MGCGAKLAEVGGRARLRGRLLWYCVHMGFAMERWISLNFLFLSCRLYEEEEMSSGNITGMEDVVNLLHNKVFGGLAVVTGMFLLLSFNYSGSDMVLSNS